MAVAARSDGVGQQETVQPGMDNAVARTQGNAAAGRNEAGQLMMRLDVDRLRIGRRVAEGLHHHVGREAEAGEILQLVAGHRAGGVLRPHGGHLRLAIGTRTDALALGQAASAADHLLGQGEAAAGIGRDGVQAEQGRGGQPERFAGPRRQAAADDQRNAAAGAHFVEDHVGFDGEFRDDLAVLQRLALIGAQLDDVAGLHLIDVELDRQGAGIFHGVVEDRGDLGTQAHAAEALVRHVGNILAGPPQHRVGRRFARRAGADHVADIGDLVAFLEQRVERLDRAALAGLLGLDARARILQHRQGMQRNVGSAPGVGGRRQVVGVGLARHLEDGDGQALGHLGARGEPLGVGPAPQQGLGGLDALVGQVLDVVEIVEHQERGLQALDGGGAAFGVFERLDQRLDVEAAQHGAEQLGRLDTADQRAPILAVDDGGQIGGLDRGGVVDTGGNAVGDQIEEEVFLARGRGLEQGDQLAGLFRRQGQRGDTEGSAFGHMLTIGFEHGVPFRVLELGKDTSQTCLARPVRRKKMPVPTSWRGSGAPYSAAAREGRFVVRKQPCAGRMSGITRRSCKD